MLFIQEDTLEISIANYLSIPILQRYNRWSLEMDK